MPQHLRHGAEPDVCNNNLDSSCRLCLRELPDHYRAPEEDSWGLNRHCRTPAEVDLHEAARAIYSMTMGLGLFTHVLGKDAMTAKKTWMTSVERVLLLDRKRKNEKQ
jgi:hypothetical protein